MAENKAVTAKDELAKTFNETVVGKPTLILVFVSTKLFTEALAVSPADTAVDESDTTVLFAAEVTVAVIGADELANFTNAIEAARVAVTAVDEFTLWFFVLSAAMVIVIGDEVER